MTADEKAASAAAPARPAAPDGGREPSPFGDRGFRRLFLAAAVSQTGTQVTALAVPVLAVTTLDAGPAAVGGLGALSTAAFLVVGLPAGAWVDRWRRRRVMIVADLVRAALLAWVPVAAWLGVLALWQLYAVVVCTGVATVFFDVSSLSLLPGLLGRDRLLRANGALSGMYATSEVAGLTAGGVLVQTLTAPVALLLDIASYLWSAACLRGIPARVDGRPRPAGTTLLREVGEGLRYVLGHPVLRPALLEGACINAGAQMCFTLLPVLFLRDLHLSEGALGAYLAAGGVGVFAGSTAARALGERLGQGRALWLVGLAAMPAVALVPLVDRGPLLWVTAVAWIAVTFRVGVNTVIKASFRQRVTPDRLLGRMNATFRFLLTGSLTVGAALGGLLAQGAGVRSALWAGAALLGPSWLIIRFSAVRTLRTLDGGLHGKDPSDA
ncbi:MFS transporter [Streptomyces sp. NPDC056580]|uniref:MFS transporter n=1 Tax=Streptomyces sp. NPDC056580 TaxID=3345872 RepID=UPI00369306F5